MKTKNMTTPTHKKIDNWSPLRLGFILIPLLLGCFAAVFISAPTPATARDMVPFNGTVSGFVDSQSGTECEPLVHVINFRHANQLGAFTGDGGFRHAPLRTRS